VDANPSKIAMFRDIATSMHSFALRDSLLLVFVHLIIAFSLLVQSRVNFIEIDITHFKRNGSNGERRYNMGIILLTYNTFTT
jgi:hypothetical protein